MSNSLLSVFLWAFAFGLHTRLTDLGIEFQLLGLNLVSGAFQAFLFCWAIWKLWTNYVDDKTREYLTAITALSAVYLISCVNSASPIVTIIAALSFWSLMSTTLLIAREDVKALIDGFDALFYLSLAYLIFFGFADQSAVFFVDPLDRKNVFGTDPLTGLFNHKLSSAAFYSLASLRFLLASDLRVGRYARAGIAVFMLIASDSVTYAACTLLAYACTRSVRQGVRLTKVAYAATSLLVVLSVFSFGDFAALFGRSAELTGRTPLWILGGELLAERPILGYGYQSFFNAGIQNIPDLFWRSTGGLYVKTFENAGIQLLIETGVIGGIATLMFLTLTFVGLSRKVLTLGNDDHFYIIFSFFVVCIGSSFSVSGLFSPLASGTIVLAAMLGCLDSEIKPTFSAENATATAT